LPMFVTRRQLLRDLIDLGVSPGDTVMVHSSMRAVGPLLGGPDTVIQAILDTVGPSGTLMAYTDWEHSPSHLHLSHAELDELLDDYPAFDPQVSRARRAYGILPEFIRTWPGAARSLNPGASMTAIGARAEWFCADHPLNYGYGPGSPLAKLVEVGGKVLLLGSPFDSVTLLHYSEHMARLPEKRIIRYREPLLIDSARQWVEIEEFDTSEPVVPGVTEDYFREIIREFLEQASAVRCEDPSLARSGMVGMAESHLLDAAELHAFAVQWLEQRFGGD